MALIGDLRRSWYLCCSVLDVFEGIVLCNVILWTYKFYIYLMYNAHLFVELHSFELRLLGWYF